MIGVIEIIPELIADLETAFEHHNGAMVRLAPLDSPWKAIKFVGGIEYGERLYGLCPIIFTGLRGIFDSAIIRANWIPNGILTIGANMRSIIDVHDTVRINSVEFNITQVL